MSNYRTKTLETLAERVMGNKSTYKNVAFTQLYGQVIGLRNSVEALSKLHANPNPTETKEAHYKRVSSAAKLLIGKTNDMRESIHYITQQGLKSSDERIRKKVNLNQDGYSAEIRQAFRTMKKVDQYKLLNQLAAENRGPELAAIVKAPSTLTGLSEKDKSTYIELIQKIHAPEEWQESTDLVEALSTALIASDVAVKTAEEFSNDKTLANIERMEAASHQANAEFTNSLIVSNAPTN